MFPTQIIYINFQFNQLPNDKILDMTNLKAFAHNKLNVDKMMINLFNSEENTVRKEENT